MLDAIDKETGVLDKAKLTAPVTFARYTGQEDRNQRNALIEHPRRTIPELTVDLTPDAGHGLLFQYPEQLTHKINRFLHEHD